MEAKNNSIDWISKAKGLGILGVVAVHVVQKFSAGAFSEIAFAGQYCVQLFFAISAYLAFKSLDRNNVDWNVKSYIKYLAHKIVRLIPVLYTAVLFHILFQSLKQGAVPAANDEIWLDALFALSFLNGFSYHHINPWANWYIGTLVIFIALAPLIKKFLNSPKRAVATFALSTVISYALVHILEKCGIDTGWYFYLWFPNQFPAMMIGIVFYYFEKYKETEDIKHSAFTFLFVVAFGFLLAKCFASVLQGHIQYGILLFAFSYALFDKANTGKIFDWLKILGKNSYGIYLYHACFIPIIAKFTKIIGLGDNFIGFAFCYILLIGLSLLCSIIANALIEKPFFNFMKNKFGV